MPLTRPLVLTPWADAGDKVQPTDPEISTGWPLTTIPPSRQRFNWLQNQLHNGIRYLARRGLPDWSELESYEVGDRCLAPDGSTYRCIADNINITPASDPTKWERWGYSEGELDAKLAGLLPYGAPAVCPNTGPLGTDNKALLFKSALGEYWMWLGDAWRVINGHYAERLAFAPLTFGVSGVYDTVKTFTVHRDSALSAAFSANCITNSGTANYLHGRVVQNGTNVMAFDTYGYQGTGTGGQNMAVSGSTSFWEVTQGDVIEFQYRLNGAITTSGSPNMEWSYRFVN